MDAVKRTGHFLAKQIKNDKKGKRIRHRKRETERERQRGGTIL